VDIGGTKFKVRLMKGWSDDVTVQPPSSPASSELLNPLLNEWDDLVYPLYEYVPTSQRMANVQQQTRTQLKLDATNVGRFMCQERWQGSTPIFRGITVAGRPAVTTIGVDGNVSITANFMSWWPVLELVEN